MVLLVALALLAGGSANALLPGGSAPARADVVCCNGQPAYDSVNTDGQADSGTGAVAYKPGGPGRHVAAPDALLWRTSYGEMRSCNCWMASSDTGCVPDPPPGVPDDERPNRSLLTAPSI